MKIIDLRDLNRQVEPVDDFFEFANGGWIKNNPIPATEIKWGSFYELTERNRKLLYGLVKEVSAARSGKAANERKVADFFISAMDTGKINKAGLYPLRNELQKIDGIESPNDLMQAVARLHVIGASSLWFPHVEQDDKDSERMVFRIYQNGLGLPDRDHYIKTDKRAADTRKEYLKYTAKTFRLMGYKPQKAQAAADKILEMETRLAHASMTRVEQRDVHKMYNKFTLARLRRTAPHIPWDAYLKGIGIKKPDGLIVSQPGFVKEIGHMVQSVQMEDWKTYLRFRLVSDYSPHLPGRFEKEHFRFYGTVLNGVKKMKPRWKRAIKIIDGALGDALGQLYVKKYFPVHAKERMDALVDNIIAAYRERIKNLDWMSAVTKKKALKKLGAVVKKIGYPDKWRDYSKLEISRDSHLKNIINSEVFDFKRKIAKLGKPIDRTEWLMSPPTVNAYYYPNLNDIVFPAGILQPPYFSDTADDAVNYGAIGAIIGHELTHGFDDQGRHFDDKGNLRNWWTEQDRKQFENKTEALVKQYDEYAVVDDMRVNGRLTLGENIADLGGLVIAYDALQLALKGKKQKRIDGFTPEQRFFIGIAVAFRAVYRPEAAREQALVDPHSPAKFRVNGPLSNMTQFYEAFGCEKGDALYRPEKERVKIW
ncbi:MAG: M13 family metallopeptidase [Candidatus Yanofskybacteria bacterium]|nr:M13 family metallopeptidase [Candidatus Yanofskybacteria bacterium]